MSTSRFVLVCCITLSLAGVAYAAPLPPTVTTTGNKVSGQAEPNMTVIVTTSGGSSCTATADQGGAYSCVLPDSASQPLKTGEEVFAQTKDASGALSPITNGGTLTITPQQSQGFLRDGIFGCAAGEYGMSVGTLQAIGGVYVPVNDAAVTRNTGYLVYKECVLDGVVVRMREAASGAIVRSVLSWANTGDRGNPQFVDNKQAHDLLTARRAANEAIKDYNFSKMCGAYKTPIRAALARSFTRATEDPNASYACSTSLSQEKLSRCFEGDFSSCGTWDDYFRLVTDPANTPLGAYVQAQSVFSSKVANELRDENTRLQWSNGFKDTTETVQNPTETGEQATSRRTLTPGYLISQLVTQAAGSGFRQLEAANEIDQIVNTMFSGITNQILTDVRGLRGLSEPRQGQAPYLDQLSAEASRGVRTAAGNAALTIVNSTVAAEQAFRKAKTDTKAALERAASQLRAAEDRCWQLLVPRVQSYAQNASCTTASDGTRSCASAPTLRVSTSTQQITGGTLALQVGTSSTVTAGSTYVLSVAPTSLLRQSSVQVTATENRNFASSTEFGLRINSTLTPAPGGTVALTAGAAAPFSGGSLTLALQTAQQLPVGELRFALQTIAPFIRAVGSVTVSTIQQFSEAVIAIHMAPAITQIDREITNSNEGLAELARIANDVQNTNSPTAAQIALKRIDTLVAERLIHTAYDARQADQQREATAASINTLVEETIKEWTTGSGWCNAENESVLRMWLDRWKTS